MARAIATITEMLEHFRTRMGMYIHPEDVPNVRSFLAGVVEGLRSCGIRWETDVYQTVIDARGWNPDSPIGPEHEMEKRGMSTRQIIDELITIEIEILRQSNIEGTA